jgi:hypothetical protein
MSASALAVVPDVGNLFQVLFTGYDPACLLPPQPQSRVGLVRVSVASRILYDPMFCEECHGLIWRTLVNGDVIYPTGNKAFDYAIEPFHTNDDKVDYTIGFHGGVSLMVMLCTGRLSISITSAARQRTGSRRASRR